MSSHCKMVALPIFASNFQKLILFGRHFSTSQIPANFFLNMHSIRKKQRNSGKFSLSKYWFCDKRPVEHAILPFLVFSFLQHDMSFVKMTNFPLSAMLKIFMIWKPFTYICKKRVLLSIISKFRKYEIFHFFKF